MRELALVLALSCASLAYSQTPSEDQQQPPEQQNQQQPQAQGGQNRSVLGVKPGAQAIKQKDLYDQTGILHPFVRMPKYVLIDQKRIWTSPFHSSKKDVKYWAIFGGATALLITVDSNIQRNAPNPGWLVSLGTNGSYLGAAYTLLPLNAGFYFIGSKFHNERFREAGLLSFEALASTTIVEEVLKVVTDRQRPLEGAGNGNFFQSNDRINASFPSGHAINTFAMASVFAHEFHDKLWVKILCYTYAGGVALSRLAADRHFPSDTLAGGAMGWFIGDYVYGKRHNPEIGKESAAEKVLDHIHFGYDPPPPIVGRPGMVW